MLQRLIRMAVLTAVLMALGGLRVPPVPASASRPALVDASPTIDDLVARFLDALHARDRAALHALRVNRAEYLGVILPGSVPEGAPLRDWPEETNQYYWSVLHTKSTYYEAYLITGFGGHQYTVDAMAYRKGTQSFATYNAYRQLALMVHDEDGRKLEIRTGSIAEVDGKYKFVSFIRD